MPDLVAGPRQGLYQLGGVDVAAAGGRPVEQEAEDGHPDRRIGNGRYRRWASRREWRAGFQEGKVRTGGLATGVEGEGFPEADSAVS